MSTGDSAKGGRASKVSARVVIGATLALLAGPVLVDLAVSGRTRPFGYAAPDAFYYLTIARSIARHGLPAFDGEHATNGFHPLWQFLLGLLTFLTEHLGIWQYTLLVAVIVGLALTAGGGPREPSRFTGRSGATSSSFATCHPERVECNGTRTRILFHTQSEPSPWFEFDLGKDYALSEIYLQNRSDYCPDCAVPLVVEVSSDYREFRVAARRFSVFDRLTLPLATRGRYVRVRVTRQSFLHLEDIRVYGRAI